MVELDDGLAQTIRRAVQARREDAVSLLQKLVHIPSVTGEEGAVGEVVGRAFSERGLDVDTWEATREETEPYRDHVGEQSSYENRPNVAGVRSGTGIGRSILLNAHTDTVDPGDPTAWKGDPLSGNLEGDLLYGRGSCDMKGGLVTHLVALDAVRDEGVSALEKFVPIFENLSELEQERNGVLSHPLYDGVSNKVPINIGVVRAGNWASTVPESLVAEGRVGLIPGEEVDPFKSLFSERIAALAERDPWLREHPPELTWFGGQFAPAEVEPDAPICEALKKAHEWVTGKEPPVEGVPYGADMRIFIRFGEMPCVMYGAGDVNVAHAPDEHMSVTELLTAASTLACLLIDWCGVDED